MEQKTTTIQMPGDGNVSMTVPPGFTIQFGFEPENGYSFTRDGNDLLVIGKEGESVTLADYFAVQDPKELPGFILDDGEPVEALAFLATVNPEMDTHIAIPGSGTGEYGDDSGELLTGLERLGDQGTDFWTRTPRVPELPQQSALLSVDGPAPLPPAELPPLPPEEPKRPDPQGPFPYQARAVLHSQDADPAELSSYFVNAAAIADDAIQPLAWNPAATAATVTYLGGDGPDLLLVDARSNGEVYFTLSQQALDYLMGSGESEIELYYEVTVNGQSYTMQVIVPNAGNFDSSQYWQSCKHGPREDGTLVYGEWHAGRAIVDNDKVYKVTSSNMSDIMTYDGVVQNSEIYAGHGSGDWGADRIDINCHVQAINGANTIKANGADSAITVRGDMQQGGVVTAGVSGSNLVEASGKNGTIAIENASGDGVSSLDSTALVTVRAMGENGRISIRSGQGTGILAQSGMATVAADDVSGTVAVTDARTGIDALAKGIAEVSAAIVTVNASETGIHARDGQAVARGDTVTVTVAGTAEVQGLMAEGESGKDATIRLEGNTLDVSAVSTGTASGAACGVLSRGEGAQTLLEGQNVTVHAASTAENAHGVWADGQNSLTRLTADTLHVSASSGDASQPEGGGKAAYALYVEDEGAENRITAREATFRAETNTGTATAIYTARGFNNLDIESHLSLEALSQTGTAYGLNVVNGTQSAISVEAMSIDLEGRSAYGIAPSGGSTSVVNAGHLTISADSQFTSAGGYVSSPGNINEINLSGADADGNALSIGLNGSNCFGFYNVSGETRITNTGTGNMDIRARQAADNPGGVQGTPAGSAYGFNNMAGTMSIINTAAEKPDITISLAGSRAVEGISSGGSTGVLNLDGAANLKIDVTGYGDTAGFGHNAYGCVGIDATQGGTVLIENVTNLEVTATAVKATPSSPTQYHTAGILSHESGRIEINTGMEEANRMSFTVSGNKYTAGILAYGDPTSNNQATHILVGGKGTTDVDFNVTSTCDEQIPYARMWVAGIYGDGAWQNNGSNLAEVAVTGRNISFDIEAKGIADAAALYADVSSEFTLTGESVTADVDATSGNAYGFAVLGTSEEGVDPFNDIHADSVRLNVSSSESSSYGLLVDTSRVSSHNSIESGDGKAITVLIETRAGDGKTAYGMYASGGYNTIVGHSVADSSDSIDITGNILTINGGSNSIATGSGNDRVRIAGDVTGSNAITTGDGDDVIILKGVVNGGSLRLDAGAGGTDVLVLQAADGKTFSECFQNWFAAMTDAAISAMNIEQIRIIAPDMSDTDVSWLVDRITQYNLDNPGSIIDIGPALTPYVAAAAEAHTAANGPEQSLDLPPGDSTNNGISGEKPPEDVPDASLESGATANEAAFQETGPASSGIHAASSALLPPENDTAPENIGEPDLVPVTTEKADAPPDPGSEPAGQKLSGTETLQGDDTTNQGSGATANEAATEATSPASSGIHAAVQTFNTAKTPESATAAESLDAMSQGQSIEAIRNDGPTVNPLAHLTEEEDQPAGTKPPEILRYNAGAVPAGIFEEKNWEEDLLDFPGFPSSFSFDSNGSIKDLPTLDSLLDGTEYVFDFAGYPAGYVTVADTILSREELRDVFCSGTNLPDGSGDTRTFAPCEQSTFISFVESACAIPDIEQIPGMALAQTSLFG